MIYLLPGHLLLYIQHYVIYQEHCYIGSKTKSKERNGEFL